MFRCERCGSSYNPLHAAVTENCPRCLIRDRVNAPLTFKMFRLPLDRDDGSVRESPAPRQDEQDLSVSRSQSR